MGAGPAGCPAVFQCRRLGLNVILIDSLGIAGGLVGEARLIENCPGLEKPLSGPAFAQRLISFISRHNIEVKCFHADSIKRSDSIFSISGNGGNINSRTVIAAVGTEPEEFSIPLIGDVSIHRSILGLKKHHPESAVIIGGGEAALDYALNLCDSGSKVWILVRDSRLKTAGELKLKAECRREIKILYNTAAVSASRSNEIILLEAESSGKVITLKTDAVLAAVGRKSRMPELMIDFDPGRGSINTSIPGLFVAGDASLGSLGQAGIASGQGIQAAVFANNIIQTGSGKL